MKRSPPAAFFRSLSHITGCSTSYGIMKRTAISTIVMIGGMICGVQSGRASVMENDSLARIRKAREFFINGTALQLQGDKHAEAVLEFQQALRYDSASVTLNAMARSYLELHKVELAREAAEASTRRSPQQPEGWELLAEILISEGRYDEAIEAYERIQGLEPTRRQLYTLGRLYEPRDPDRAIAVFERLMKMEPDLGVLRRLAELYQRTKQNNGLVSALERAQQMAPASADIASDLVRTYLQAGKVDAAASLLRSWATKDQDIESRAGVWLSGYGVFLSDSVLTLLNTDTVTGLLDTGSQRFAQIWPVMVAGGAVALRIQDSTRASAQFRQAVAHGKGDAEVPLQIAMTYLTLAQWQHAYDILAQGVGLHPQDARFPFFMASACMQMDRDSLALLLYRRTVTIEPGYTDAWIQMGLLFDMAGKPDSSDVVYEKALELEPDNHLANNNYAYSLAVRGRDLERARLMSWRAVQQYPANPSYLDTYAWVLYQSGDYDKARTYIERAIARGGNATHYEHLGDILERLGLLDEAVRAWETALEKDPGRDSIQHKLSRYR